MTIARYKHYFTVGVILDRFHHQFEHSYVYQLLKQLAFSWITSRSRHPKQSQAAQDEFKKTAT